MQARCPHCQNIFPTERGGVQFCPSCGKQINVPIPPGMAPPPAGGTGDASGPVTGSTPAWGTAPQAGGGGAGTPGEGAPFGGGGGGPGVERAPTPWELRKSPKTWFETWKGAMGSDKFWSSVRPTGSLWDALTFGWIASAIQAVLSLPFQLLELNSNRAEMARAMGELPPEFRKYVSFFADNLDSFTWGGPLFSILFAPLYLIISSAFLHLFCLMVGAAKNGFTATARAVSYAYAPIAVGFITIGGVVPLLAALYWMVLSVWGVTRLQDTTAGRAIGAMALAILIPCCCLCVGAVVAGMGAAAMAGNR